MSPTGIIIRHDLATDETQYEADGLGTDRRALQGYAITKGHFLDLTREGEFNPLPTMGNS